MSDRLLANVEDLESFVCRSALITVTPGAHDSPRDLQGLISDLSAMNQGLERSRDAAMREYSSSNKQPCNFKTTGALLESLAVSYEKGIQIADKLLGLCMPKLCLIMDENKYLIETGKSHASTCGSVSMLVAGEERLREKAKHYLASLKWHMERFEHRQ